MTDDTWPKNYRAVWISDVHLGTKDCKADLLLEFLRTMECDHLYLVGDMIDGWRLKRGWYWPQAHNDVVQKVLRKARKGTRVVYVPGNHDEFARQYVGHSFGAVEVAQEAIHKTADGRRLLIVHGDEFDCVVCNARWLAVLGDYAYTVALSLNHWFDRILRRLGYPYWSLSAYLKYKVKNAVKFIADYETTVMEAARMRGVDGVVCGHIHHAEFRDDEGFIYGNAGDWVESCTALVEHPDGRMEVIHWPRQQAPLIAFMDTDSCES